MYYVYVHTVPNGKIYIGQTKLIEKRWNNGEGYIDNKPFYNAIQQYGWNNIKHEIVAEFNDRESALQFETILIVLLKAENENYGYNQTHYYDTAMKLYNARKMVDGINFENPQKEQSFFESFNLPLSVCEDMINQWIFNEEHRCILKDRLLNGMDFVKLSEKYGKSVRQIKNIVYDNCGKLEKRM